MTNFETKHRRTRVHTYIDDSRAKHKKPILEPMQVRLRGKARSRAPLWGSWRPPSLRRRTSPFLVHQRYGIPHRESIAKTNCQHASWRFVWGNRFESCHSAGARDPADACSTGTTMISADQAGRSKSADGTTIVWTDTHRELRPYAT